MLKLLVRLTALGITIFLAALAGMFLAAGENDFPWGTDHSARLDFSQTQLTKDEAISALDAMADGSDLRLAKVVADPEEFLTSKYLYVFGSEAPSVPVEMDWFRADMRGELRSSSDLGDASLDGTYVFSGSTQAADRLVSWANQSGVSLNVQVKTAPAVLQYALINTGAWLPALTSFVLLISLTVSWYVLRARARSIKVLSGTRSSRIFTADLISLLRVSALPAAVGFILALTVVAVQGNAAYLLQFGSITLAFLAVALGVLLVSAILVSAVTWPTVSGIASRVPPERHFRLISETLKVVTLVVVAVSLPAAGSAIAASTFLSEQGARWEALTGQVSLRIGGSIDDFDAHIGDMDALVQAAQSNESLTFSYSQSAETIPALTAGGFDGMVMVNRAYLKAIAPVLEMTSTADRPLGDFGTAVAFNELPTAVTGYLSSSYELWNRQGRTTEGLEENLLTYRYSGPDSFPGLAAGAGEMDDFQRPLLVIVEEPGLAFNSSFLSSTLSSGNLMFSDSQWLHDQLDASPLEEIILSVDSVSDSGLYSSQQQNQTAAMRTLSYVLVMLALVASVAVSAWIYALARGRRLFVQRTSGWTWRRALSRRMIWESSLAVVVTAVVLVSSRVTENPEVWWAAAAAPIYITLSGLLHRGAARSIFARRVARAE